MTVETFLFSDKGKILFPFAPPSAPSDAFPVERMPLKKTDTALFRSLTPLASGRRVLSGKTLKTQI